MAERSLLLGIDFGTDSVRAVLLDGASGKEEATAVAAYPRWAKGLYCNPEKNQFRQHPLDYVEAMEACVKGALAKLPSGSGRSVVGIGIDTTGSTPVAVTKDGRPLALTAGFEENPNAMFVLWKDHTGLREAEEINRTARSWGGPDFTRYEGGIYSSEWFWAKVLHVLRADEKVRKAAFSWIEHCDWMPALLTGTTDPLTMKRSRCAAGHKAMWHKEWNGLPDEAFLVKLDPLLKGLRERLYTETQTSDVPAGKLTKEWAERLGLAPGIVVAVGAFDAHMGAVGGGIHEGSLVKIMGTSTCDVIVARPGQLSGQAVPGICGEVDGSIIPGMIGLEAGQSAFGDVYAWFRDLLSWPVRTLLPTLLPDGHGAPSEKLTEKIEDAILPKLAEEASRIPPSETGPIALDWLNGRRTPFADQGLKGAILGLTLGSSAPRLYRTLVEATAFGSRRIAEHFVEAGIPLGEVIALGGIAQKSEFVMQVTADVMGTPIKVARSEQTVALGAAIFAAVAAGRYASVQEAQKTLTSGFSRTFTPEPKAKAIYDKLYRRYLEVGKLLEPELRKM